MNILRNKLQEMKILNFKECVPNLIYKTILLLSVSKANFILTFFFQLWASQRLIFLLNMFNSQYLDGLKLSLF